MASNIQQTAKRLLARQEAEHGFGFAISQDIGRQAIFMALYIAIPIVLLRLEYATLAIASACLFAGAKIRDFRWLFALYREWPNTEQFLDWEKVEHFAAGTNV